MARLMRKDLLIGMCVILLTTSLAPVGLAAEGDQAEEEPHVVSMEWEGHLACTARWTTLGVLPYSGVNTCGVVELYAPGATDDDFLLEWQIEENLKSVVGAMVWEGDALEPDLQLYMEVAGRSSRSPGYVDHEGGSPLQWRVDAGYVEDNYPEHLHRYDFNNVEGSLDLQFRVFAGGDLSVVVDQPFTMYWDLYYGEPAPEDASALP